MVSGKSSDGRDLEAVRDRSLGKPRGGISVRFRRGPAIAVVAAALLWAGIVALWRLL